MGSTNPRAEHFVGRYSFRMRPPHHQTLLPVGLRLAVSIALVFGASAVSAQGNLRLQGDRARIGEQTQYSLEVTLAQDLTSFELVETIRYRNEEDAPMTEVALRLYANAVGESPRLEVLELSCPGRPCTHRAPDSAALVVTPETALGAGEEIEILVRVRGQMMHIDPSRSGLMAQAMEGLQSLGSSGGHGDYGLMSYSGNVASLGNFYAMIADRHEGEWVLANASTLGDLGVGPAANFRILARVPAGYEVAISGEVVRDETRIGGMHEVESVASLSRNVALVTGEDLRVHTRRVGGVEVRSWHTPDRSDEARHVLDAAARSLEIFQRRFGPYPYRDLDVAQAPLVGGAGGVEFSGLVTVATMFYGEPGGGGILGALMGSGALSSGQGGGMVQSMREFVVVHEVAHQWWHGIVGSDARRHPFVDESLAQFSSIQYMREAYGQERATLEARRQVASNYHMMRQQGFDDAPVDQPVAGFQGALSYAGLVYGKGAFAYERSYRAMGARRFFRGVRGYVQDHRFGIAPSRALFDRLARVGPRARVRRIERRWLEEMHGDEDLGTPDPSAALGDWFGAPGAGPTQNVRRGQGGGGQAGPERILREVLRNGGQNPDAILRRLLGGRGSNADLQRAVRALQNMP